LRVRKSFAVAVLVLAVVAGVVGVSPSSGGAQKRYTIAFVTDGTANSYIKAAARGGREAAKALGVRYILAGTFYGGPGPPGTTHPYHDLISVFKSVIARHVDAIVTRGYTPALTPILNKVRASGIPLLAAAADIAAKRDVWVSESDPVAYAHTLADALASQTGGTGEYAIVGEGDQYPIATEWEKLIEAYVAKTYPKMKLDAVVTGTGAGDPRELASVEDFIVSHPNLRGLIGVTPTEMTMAAEAITETRKIGTVFAAGDAGGSFDDPLPDLVRSGAVEVVVAGPPVKIGYLSIWAAHYLVTGHSFKPGLYHVGGPIGFVRYYAAHHELRLGEPLTITKANVNAYANTF
jgi:ABC-type sugar transport system substrate-binding protein